MMMSASGSHCGRPAALYSIPLSRHGPQPTASAFRCHHTPSHLLGRHPNPSHLHCHPTPSHLLGRIDRWRNQQVSLLITTAGGKAREVATAAAEEEEEMGERGQGCRQVKGKGQV